MTIRIESTTDTQDAVNAALGDLKQPKEQEVEKSESAQTEEQDEKAEESETSEEVEKSDESSDDDDETPSEEKPKKKGGFKRRIDKLNGKLSAAEQEIEYWKRKALKDENSERERPAPTQESAANDKPKADDFESHEEYVEALADWKVEQKLAKRDLEKRQKALRSDHERQVEQHVERVKEFAKTRPDFDELMEDVDDIPMSVTVQEVILGSEIGPELMYELAKNREEYDRICKLPAIAAARALGKIEARISRETDTDKKVETKKTKAPPPLNPVRSKGTSVHKDPEKMDYQEYKKWRLEQANR